MDSAGKSVQTSLVKFIPVKMSWRGQSWLGPCILAHTTTKWWNHAVCVNIPIKIHDLKDEKNTSTLKCMPKAATVYVPGSFKYICLVIVDVVEASFPITEYYYIGNTYRAPFRGNFDFGKIGRKIIGSNIDATTVQATMVDCMAAWRVMCKSLLSHVNPGAIEIKLAVLATSMFAGFSVWTDEAKAKKASVSAYQGMLSDLDIDEDDAPTDLLGWLELLNRAAQPVVSSEESEDDDTLKSEDKVSIIKTIIDSRFGQGSKRRLVDEQTWSLMQAATNDFVITSCPSTTNTAWTDKTFKIIDVIKTQLGVTDDKWAEHWYGGVVPWWFVQAVLMKFGGSVVVKTVYNQECQA